MQSQQIDPRRLVRQALIIFAEAAIFGIGVELGKDLYHQLRKRRASAEEAAVPPGVDGGEGANVLPPDAHDLTGPRGSRR